MVTSTSTPGDRRLGKQRNRSRHTVCSYRDTWMMFLQFAASRRRGEIAQLSFGSTIVIDVLIPNLIPIVIALLAINVQTTAVVAVKLRELSDTHKVSFKASFNQFKLALFEQTGLVVASCLLGTLAKSAEQMAKHNVLVEWGSFAVLTAAIHIFLDTSIGLIMALFPSDD